jgi:hypothetical protein
VRVYYHVAAMGSHWDSIVTEQLTLLRDVGVSDVWVGFLGSAQDLVKFRRLAEGLVSAHVVYVNSSFNRYELPTQEMLWYDAMSHGSPTYLYMHTKGASCPMCPRRIAWRALMQAYVVSRWRKNVGILRTHDILGVGWQVYDGHWHFPGTFWMARGDWIRKLPRPFAYQASRKGNLFGSPWERMCAETWVCSRPPRVFSYVHAPWEWCHDVKLMEKWTEDSRDEKIVLRDAHTVL